MSLSIAAATAAHHPSLHGRAVSPLGGLPPGDADRIEVPVEQVRFTRLRSAQQLREIQHLREELSLPADVRNAPSFIALEKKEMRRASWAPSSAWGR
jgi:hypothetical protein